VEFEPCFALPWWLIERPSAGERIRWSEVHGGARDRMPCGGGFSGDALMDVLQEHRD